MRRFLRSFLSRFDYRLVEAATGEEALAAAAERSRRTSCCSTWGCPTWTGKTCFCGCASGSSAPIIVLSVRDQEKQKIMALNHGADDYLTKPFSTGELLRGSRWRSGTRRRRPAARRRPCSSAAIWSIDRVARRVTVARRRRAADAARVQTAGDDGAARGQGADAPVSAGRGVGAQAGRRTCSICGCSWRDCGGRSRTNRRGRGISSRSKAWGIAWRRSEKSSGECGSTAAEWATGIPRRHAGQDVEADSRGATLCRARCRSCNAASRIISRMFSSSINVAWVASGRSINFS